MKKVYVVTTSDWVDGICVQETYVYKHLIDAETRFKKEVAIADEVYCKSINENVKTHYKLYNEDRATYFMQDDEETVMCTVSLEECEVLKKFDD
jgi:hypothetical protein